MEKMPDNATTKKILYLITRSEIGGAQKYVLDLARGAVQAGYITVVASEHNSHFYESLSASGIPFIEIKNLKRNIDIVADAKLFFELIKIIRTEKPDIVHLNSSKIGALGAPAAKLCRVPHVVFTAHGWAFNDPRGAAQKYLIALISRLAAFFQDRIICVSDYDRKRALELDIATSEKLTTVRNGLDARAIHFLNKKEARAKLGLDDKSLAIGTIANFYKTKAVETLVLSAISASYLSPDIKFVLIGDGPERNTIENLIKKYRLEEFFVLTGALRGASQYLKAFDIFVLPSKKEGLPYALLEAMSAKTACVASAVGGIPEIIRDGQNGLLVENMTPGKLRDRLSWLIHHKKEMKSLGAAAAETVRSEFSLDRMIKETLAVYS